MHVDFWAKHLAWLLAIEQSLSTDEMPGRHIPNLFDSATQAPLLPASLPQAVPHPTGGSVLHQPILREELFPPDERLVPGERLGITTHVGTHIGDSIVSTMRPIREGAAELSSGPAPASAPVHPTSPLIPPIPTGDVSFSFSFSDSVSI